MTLKRIGIKFGKKKLINDEIEKKSKK